MNSTTAIKILLSLIGIVTLFHLCILVGIIPYEITWGGRLKSDAEMYVFESISITINALFGLVLLIKGDYVRPIISLRVIDVLLWIFLIIFVLNTIGNIFAATTFEKSLSLLTAGTAVLLWIILRNKN